MFRRQKYPRYQQENQATDKERFHALTTAAVACDWDSCYNRRGKNDDNDIKDNESLLRS